ncbi:MAG: alpha-mannosidase [Fimbriimonadaceae bacterium]|nr:alpha-mannosidase [Fimbriimonadaceae bacterium]
MLRPRIHGPEHPLTIEMHDADAPDQRTAIAGTWRPVTKGEAWGPAYRTVWFRLRGTVPADFAGQRLAVVAELGGERTVWKENTPWCGVDVEHSDFGWLTGAAMAVNDPVAEGGEAVEYYVQAYARNSETRVHGREAPRRATTEVVDRAAICPIDFGIKALVYDIEFALNLLDTLPKDDPAAATLLRALNDVVNAFLPGTPEQIARSRKLIAEALGTLNGEMKHTIYPVGHAHLDTAWLWPIRITRQKMAHTTATQLGLMERYPNYVFVHSQASQYEWLETEYPALFDRVKAAIARGQWEPVGSMWVEADCNLTGAESLVRQFLYGRRYFREKLGVQTEDMWLPDVFGYSAALPQILQKFNIKYFLTQKISWNQFNKFPHHTFWWQGIDGTRVWTHFPPADTYNASAEPKEVVFSVRNYKDHARSDASLYVYGFGDGGGGPTERHIEFLLRGRLAPHYPDVAFGKRALDFFREAKSKSKDLQTWSGELYLELHRGTYTSQAENKKQNRKCEFLLRDAEWLSTFRPGYPHHYPQADLERAWKLVLLNQFHDIIPGSSVREVYEDSDRDYAVVREIGNRIVAQGLRSIGKLHDRAAMERPVALFRNVGALGMGASKVGGEAEIALHELPDAPDPLPNALVVGPDVIPVQEVDAFGERKLIFATPESAIGAVVVGDLTTRPLPPRGRLKAFNRRIENHEWSVRFDNHGNITGITRLEDGQEFIEPGRLANVFQLFEDRPNFWSAWDIDAFALETGVDLIRSESFEVVERGPVRVAVEVVKKFGQSRIRQRISLGPTPGVRFDTEIDWHEEDRMLKVAFPANVNATRAHFEIQFGNVERPTHRNTSWEMAKFEVCAHKWVDISEGELGLALINDAKYGFDVHQNVVRMTLLRAPKAPDPECDMGRHRFGYVLYPHDDDYARSGVVANAYAFNAPLRYAFVPTDLADDQDDGDRTEEFPDFIACNHRNVVVETVKKAEHGHARIVRLYECHNTRGRGELVLPAAGVRRATLCDLEENELVELDVADGVVTFDYKPFEILTIKLEN